jgi:hypothetical protein
MTPVLASLARLDSARVLIRVSVSLLRQLPPLVGDVVKLMF